MSLYGNDVFFVLQVASKLFVNIINRYIIRAKFYDKNKVCLKQVLECFANLSNLQSFDYKQSLAVKGGIISGHNISDITAEVWVCYSEGLP